MYRHKEWYFKNANTYEYCNHDLYEVSAYTNTKQFYDHQSKFYKDSKLGFKTTLRINTFTIWFLILFTLKLMFVLDL